MPLSVLVEIVVQPIIEVVAHVFGYLTGIVVVPLFTLGVYRVERLAGEKPHPPPTPEINRWALIPPKLISADAAVFFGLLFWAAVGATAVWLYYT